MKYIKTYKLFEGLDNDIISTLKDICLEFEDKDYRYIISDYYEKNDYFYIDIDIPGFSTTKFPSWFVDTCRAIEYYMISEGYKTLPAINYEYDWVNLDKVDDLDEEFNDSVYKVQLEFFPLEDRPNIRGNSDRW